MANTSLDPSTDKWAHQSTFPWHNTLGHCQLDCSLACSLARCINKIQIWSHLRWADFGEIRKKLISNGLPKTKTKTETETKYYYASPHWACVWGCVCGCVEYAATAIRHASARGKFCGIWGIWFRLRSHKSPVPAQPSANTRKETELELELELVAVTWQQRGNTCDQSSYL